MGIFQPEFKQQYLHVDAKRKISNCFDSHTHLLATGQVASGLRLHSLQNLSELSQLKIEPTYFQAHWLVGFGWDQHKLFTDGRWPTKSELDQIFPDRPVYLSRMDGHTGWFNSVAEKEFERLGFDFNLPLYSGQILKQDNNPSGIFQDRAHIDALKTIPDYTHEQTKYFLIQAANLFNAAGFTHVRDLSTSTKTWALLDELLKEEKIHLCVEGNITIEDLQDLERGLRDFEIIESIKNPYLRPKGLKLFVDGSLGSQTAALKNNYLGQAANFGKLFWSKEDIETATRTCWMRGIEISFHVIGDRAADLVVRAVRDVSASGLLGRLNLEHTQVVRADTINLMKPLHITCHMQPCHWLSDKAWISKTIDVESQKNLFPWARLIKNKIPVQFGSDSPIEATSIHRNFQAVMDAAKTADIEAPSVDLKTLHSHPDQNWTRSETILSESGVEKVVFDGKQIL